MKSLLRALTMHDYGLPSYSLITRASFTLYNDKGNTVYINRNDRRNLHIELTDDNGALHISLRPLRRALEVRQQAYTDSTVCDMSFSKQDVLAFVEDVHDENTIHREAPYVVPGLLILESLWLLFRDDGYTAIEVHYYSPTLADDTIELRLFDDKQRVEAYAGTIRLFEAYFYR